jgi:hypothetical protein
MKIAMFWFLTLFSISSLTMTFLVNINISGLGTTLIMSYIFRISKHQMSGEKNFAILYSALPSRVFMIIVLKLFTSGTKGSPDIIFQISY